MVAPRQVEIPFYRSIGGKRGWGFGELAQVIETTTIAFLPKFIVPSTERMGADLLKFAVPVSVDVVSGRKN